MKNKWFLIGLFYIFAVLFASVSYGQNILVNSGFETGKTGWKNTGGTFSITSTAPNVLIEKQSASFVASGSGQFFESNAYVVPKGLWGENCMVKVLYTGADANAYLTVLDGSSVELIPTNTRAILSAASGIKTAKVYFNCPSSGSIKLRVQSTAAMVIGYFDSAELGKSDSIAISGITSDTNYSPSYTGFGVPTNVDAKYSRVGKRLKVMARFSLGTTTAVAASVSIPNGWTISNKYTSNKIFGVGYRLVPTAATKNYSITAGPNDNTLKFSASGDTQTPNPIVPITGTDIGSVGQDVTFSAEFEINEFPESELVVNSKCPNDIACENTFSAQVSAAGVVTSENLDWLNGNCTNPSAGQFNCTYNSSIFTVAPNCTASFSISASVSQSVAVVPTNIAVGVTTSTGALSSQPFSLVCQKSGPDFKAKQNIQGFLSSTVTSAANNWRLETLVTGQASKGIACTSSPCGVFNQSGAVSSVTRGSTGNYSINFLAGSFSAVPVCTFSASAGGNINCTESGGSTSSTINVGCVNAASAANIDAGINITCSGPR